MVPLFFSRSSINYRQIINSRICNLKIWWTQSLFHKSSQGNGNRMYRSRSTVAGQDVDIELSGFSSAGSECQIAWFITALLDLGEASLELATTWASANLWYQSSVLSTSITTWKSTCIRVQLKIVDPFGLRGFNLNYFTRKSKSYCTNQPTKQ